MVRPTADFVSQQHQAPVFVRVHPQQVHFAQEVDRHKSQDQIRSGETVNFKVKRHQIERLDSHPVRIGPAQLKLILAGLVLIGV